MKNKIGLNIFGLFFSALLFQYAQGETMGFYLRDQVKVLPKSRFILSVIGFQSNVNSQLEIGRAHV